MPRGRPSRSTVYKRLEGQLEELRQRLGGLPTPQEAEFIWRDIWHLEAHHSTAIEGNTLVIREVAELLERGRAVGAKSLKEYMEVKGYGDAAQWVYSQAHSGGYSGEEVVTKTEVRNIHEALMAPVWQVAPHPEAADSEAPGHFRRHDIHPFPEGMTPPSWAVVEAHLTGWIDDTNRWAGSQLESEASVPLPEMVASIHNSFEKIHPFIDGNGRTGRLVLNLILVRLGYPPIIVMKSQREAYLAAMRRADDGDCGALGELLARSMIENLNRFILPNLAGPARMIPLAALADERFSVVALRHAASRGRLQATRGQDGLWRSSRAAVEDYSRTLHQRRPSN